MKITFKRPNVMSKRPSKRKSAIIIAGIILFVIAVYLILSLGQVSTDDAYVDGHTFTTTPRVNGFVTEVVVSDNEVVEPGQALVIMESTDYEVALAQAKADLASAEAQLASLELGVPLQVNQTGFNVTGAQAQYQSQHKNLDQARKDEEAARQAAIQAQAQLHQAQLDVERMAQLRAKQVVAQAELDTAQTNVKSAQAQYQAAQAKAEATRQNVASLKADLDRYKANIDLAATGQDVAEIKTKDVQAQQAKVELAKDQVRQAELNLSYTRIVSPIHGQITRKNVEPGQLVIAGQPLLAVVPLDVDNLWVTANYKETQLHDVKPGQPVSIEVDTYPGVKIRGVVESIMAGTGAAFSLFPPENATGNFVKVVQRIPVKIILDPADPKAPQLRLGMSVVPTINTRGKVEKVDPKFEGEK